MYKLLYFLLLFIFSIHNFYGQNDFRILNGSAKEKVRFKFLNNLILLPVTLNGQDLTFLLDTGVRKSLLFNAKTSDLLGLKEVEKIMVSGLGVEKEFEALKSINNVFRIGNVICPNFELLIITDKKIDFSSRMGIDIDGIIGSELFQDFIIEINNNKKQIVFNNPKTYAYKKCKKCETFKLRFNHKKPYILGKITTKKQSDTVKLLIDSGCGDALWLFNKSINGYKIPKKSFSDILGTGLNGAIYGRKSKLKSFQIGNFKFNELIIAHPDSTSIIGNNAYFKRNGLIGSEILKRFHTIYDYPNRKITFKKNNKYYKNPFPYNKSGMELIHYGKVLVKEKKASMSFGKELNSNDGSTFAQIYSTYSYSFKNAYQISFIKENSIADKIGLKEGDILSKINGDFAYKFSLQEIIQKLSDKNGKKIKIQVNRNFLFLDFKIVLEDLL